MSKAKRVLFPPTNEEDLHSQHQRNNAFLEEQAREFFDRYEVLGELPISNQDQPHQQLTIQQQEEEEQQALQPLRPSSPLDKVRIEDNVIIETKRASAEETD